jgi:hypothetical protein
VLDSTWAGEGTADSSTSLRNGNEKEWRNGHEKSGVVWSEGLWVKMGHDLDADGQMAMGGAVLQDAGAGFDCL